MEVPEKWTHMMIEQLMPRLHALNATSNNFNRAEYHMNLFMLPVWYWHFRRTRKVLLPNEKSAISSLFKSLFRDFELCLTLFQVVVKSVIMETQLEFRWGLWCMIGDFEGLSVALLNNSEYSKLSCLLTVMHTNDICERWLDHQSKHCTRQKHVSMEYQRILKTMNTVNNQYHSAKEFYLLDELKTCREWLAITKKLYIKVEKLPREENEVELGLERDVDDCLSETAACFLVMLAYLAFLAIFLVPLTILLVKYK